MTLNRRCWDSMLSLAMIVSSFFTKEKAASWNMFQNEGFIKGFQEFGLSWKILQELCEL